MASEGASRRGGALIMGVDDDSTNLQFLRTVVEGMGYPFIGAISGVECLRMLYRVEPTVILLDVMMPEVDGFETCRRIRSDFPHLKAPIIFLTALNSPEDVVLGIGASGDDYLVKPVQPGVLRERLDYWIRKGPTQPD